MKATINGIEVEGTVKEVHELISLANAPLVLKEFDWSKAKGDTTVNIRLGNKKYSKFVEDIQTEGMTTEDVNWLYNPKQHPSYVPSSYISSGNKGKL